ncbi:MAG: DUF6132 family protein [bacterium]|nr:DUF6132 family protein [bacterium]
MNKILKYKMILIVGVIGAVAGYGYYYFVGCESGTCAITSSPINSSLYGAFMGGLIGDMFRGKVNA